MLGSLRAIQKCRVFPSQGLSSLLDKSRFWLRCLMTSLRDVTTAESGSFRSILHLNGICCCTSAAWIIRKCFPMSPMGFHYLMSLANENFRQADDALKSEDIYRSADGVYIHMCFTCGKRYKTRSKLNRHVRYECGGARNQLQCGVCGRRFSRPDNLRQHEVLHRISRLPVQK
ncbi:hypothetical protein C0J52_26313 [Blattella germanica]|nr:hypothetical protein C0J52_26313 [Blattella germanica]